MVVLVLILTSGQSFSRKVQKGGELFLQNQSFPVKITRKIFETLMLKRGKSPMGSKLFNSCEKHGKYFTEFSKVKTVGHDFFSCNFLIVLNGKSFCDL